MSAVRPLLLIGAGGIARETAAAVQAVNQVHPTWHLLGHLDDDPSRHGESLGGVPVLGPVDLIDAYPEAAIAVCTGRPDNYVSRPVLVARLGLPDERSATVVHPSVCLGSGTSVGPGTVLLAGVVTTVDVRLGRHVAVMPQVVLTHDDLVGDYATLATRVALAGGVQVGSGAYLGAGTLVREGRRVGAWSLVGMGSVVTEDVPALQTWFGSPARAHGVAPIPAGLASVTGPDGPR